MRLNEERKGRIRVRTDAYVCLSVCDCGSRGKEEIEREELREGKFVCLRVRKIQ